MPVEICWSRSEIAQPCCGSSESVLRMSRSSVPCGRSMRVAAISVPLLLRQEMLAPLLTKHKGKVRRTGDRPETRCCVFRSSTGSVSVDEREEGRPRELLAGALHADAQLVGAVRQGTDRHASDVLHARPVGGGKRHRRFGERGAVAKELGVRREALHRPVECEIERQLARGGLQDRFAEIGIEQCLADVEGALTIIRRPTLEILRRGYPPHSA